MIASTQVNEFIRCKGVADLVEKALTFVRELFLQPRTIVLEVSRDPEEGAEWVVLRVTSAAPPAELRSAYRQYVRRWVQEPPPDKRHLVRLSYRSV